MKRCPSCKKTNLTKGTTTVERAFPSRGGKVRAVVEREHDHRRRREQAP
jgi:hypothetical protein